MLLAVLENKDTRSGYINQPISDDDMTIWANCYPTIATHCTLLSFKATSGDVACSIRAEKGGVALDAFVFTRLHPYSTRASNSALVVDCDQDNIFVQNSKLRANFIELQLLR